MSDVRLTAKEAPDLYRALGWAFAAGVTLAASAFVMIVYGRFAGLGVLAVALLLSFQGWRSVVAHHSRMDKMRKLEMEEYEETIRGLSTRSTERRSQNAPQP